VWSKLAAQRERDEPPASAGTPELPQPLPLAKVISLRDRSSK
jgi:hypothetical protein